MAKEFIVYSPTKAKFAEAVANNDVDRSQIGFIADTAEVWINGGYYPFAMPTNAHSTTPRTQEYAWRASTDGEVVTDVIASVNKILGNTVRWHQMVNGLAKTTSNSITCEYDTTTNEVVITNNGRTSSLTGVTTFGQLGSTSLIVGHKYLLTSTHAWAGLGLVIAKRTAYYHAVNKVFTAETGSYAQLALTPELSIDDTYYSILQNGSTRRIKLCLFDLTEMFGADNEPSSYGEWCRLYPEPYYAPSTTKIEGTKVSSIDTPTYNLWDKARILPGIYHYLAGDFRDSVYHRNYFASALIAVMPNTAYYLVNVSNRTDCMPCVFYDKDMKYIGYGGPQSLDSSIHKLSGEIVTPKDAAYMAVMVYNTANESYIDTACVSVSSRRNGEITAYSEHQIVLDIDDIQTAFPYGLLSVVDGGELYTDELGEGYALQYVNYDPNSDGTISNLRKMQIKNESGVLETRPKYYSISQRLMMTWRVKRGATERVTLGEASAPFRASISYALDANDLLARPLEDDDEKGYFLMGNKDSSLTYRSTYKIAPMPECVTNGEQGYIPTCDQVKSAIQGLMPAAAAPATPKRIINSASNISLIANTVVEYALKSSVMQYFITSISSNATSPSAYDDLWILRGSAVAGTKIQFSTRYTIKWKDNVTPAFTGAYLFELRLRRYGDQAENTYLAEWSKYPVT